MSQTALDRALPPEDADPPRPEPARLRPLALRLHFYAGLLVAPFLLIATISGGLYAVAPTLEQFVYRDLLTTAHTGSALPVSDQITAAEQARPDLGVVGVRPAPEPGDTTRVLFADPALGESEKRAVFVDPSTAEVLGESTVYGSSSALPMRTWISQLHRNLHLGEPGRIYSELAASWLWVIALGGLYLWVGRYLRTRARNPERAHLLTPDRGATGRRRTLGWHGAVGAWIAVGLVFLSATGLTWSKYAGDNIGEVRQSLNWTTPSVSTVLGDAPADHGSGGGHDGHGTAAPVTADVDPAAVDRVLDAGRAEGLRSAVEVTFPATSEAAFVVSEVRQPWVFSNDSVAVDGATGEVTDVSRFAQWPFAAQLTSWAIQLHMGLLFGLVSQLALLALAVALGTVVVRGYVLWWRRRPTRTGSRPFGSPPRRGTLRRLHPAALVSAAVVAALVGWFVPLLGISLAAFLVIDTVIGVLRRPRTP
ncbi:PepSY domain-containing protein [Rhodococcus triatomae]|nr:PepSY domain-containing protein [Rhodococcus triatomae]QNG21134.1 PepSY domain-containing protein [Rhodococcus triatomae]QNG25574.1 PepSY domain-containing protein [Rhodococcus triatomae]